MISPAKIKFSAEIIISIITTKKRSKTGWKKNEVLMKDRQVQITNDESFLKEKQPVAMNSIKLVDFWEQNKRFNL